MANTAYPRSIHRVDLFQGLEAYRPAMSTDWSMVAAWYVEIPSTSVQWWLSLTFDCNVDLDTIGEVRFVASTGEYSNPPARIWTYVERVTLGWILLAGGDPRYVWLQARQGAGTTNTGGGIHVMQAAALLMSAPPTQHGRLPTRIRPQRVPHPSGPIPARLLDAQAVRLTSGSCSANSAHDRSHRRRRQRPHHPPRRLHDLNNLLVGTAPIGSVIVRDSTSVAVSAMSARQPHFTYAAQTKTFNHSSAGTLAFTVDAQTRAVRVNASANITDITISGMGTLGPWGCVWVRLVASATITFAFSSVVVVGSSPATLTAGQSTVFAYQNWDF